MLNSLKKYSEELIFEKKESQKKIKDIEKDRLILDYIDNPKLLWNHLEIFVRNYFFERFFIEKQIFFYFSKNSEFSLKMCAKKIADLNPHSDFAKLVKNKLNSNINFHNVPNFKTHYKKIIKEIFLNYLIVKLCQNEENFSDDFKKNIVELEKPSDAENFQFPSNKLKNLNNIFD